MISVLILNTYEQTGALSIGGLSEEVLPKKRRLCNSFRKFQQRSYEESKFLDHDKVSKRFGHKRTSV